MLVLGCLSRGATEWHEQLGYADRPHFILFHLDLVMGSAIEGWQAARITGTGIGEAACLHVQIVSHLFCAIDVGISVTPPGVLC